MTLAAMDPYISAQACLYYKHFGLVK